MQDDNTAECQRL